MQKSIRVPTQIHTRKLDRLVAHRNMKRAGLSHVNKHDYNSTYSYLIEYIPSYFARHWRETVDVPTIDLRRKKS